MLYAKGNHRPAGASVPNGTPCTQPGCAGRIQTGYCDVCGSPAGARSSSPVDDDAALSTLTRGSTTLQSMALGESQVTYLAASIG